MKLFILAERYEEAGKYAVLLKIPRASWKYLGNIDSITGERDYTVLCVGNYFLHPQYPEIDTELRMRKNVYNITKLIIKEPKYAD